MIDRNFLDRLPHELKEVLAEDCEDFLLHRSIPLHSHSYDNIIIQSSKKDTKQASLTDQSANLEDVAVKFWKQAEAEASALEVTVDYYLMEFYTS